MSGAITIWPAGMERRYGFSRQQAVGQNSHQLLRTMFPIALRDIEAALRKRHSWQGALIHRHANGRAIVVMSHWVMDDAREATVTEAHTDTISIQLADLLAILANELSQPLTAIGNYVNGARICLQREKPDHERARNAMVMAAAQLVRSAEQLTLLRGLASDLHGVC
jgi:signal transduction histidine kinase